MVWAPRVADRIGSTRAGYAPLQLGTVSDGGLPLPGCCPALWPGH